MKKAAVYFCLITGLVMTAIPVYAKPGRDNFKRPRPTIPAQPVITPTDTPIPTPTSTPTPTKILLPTMEVIDITTPTQTPAATPSSGPVPTMEIVYMDPPGKFHGFNFTWPIFHWWYATPLTYFLGSIFNWS